MALSDFTPTDGGDDGTWGPKVLDALAYVDTTDPGSPAAVGIANTYPNVLTPEAFGAVGDGTTDDAGAFADMAASALSRRATLQRGKTYKLGASTTVAQDLDLNGATLNITGRLTLSSGKMRNGTVTVTDKILVDSVAGVRIFDVACSIAGTTSDGLHVLNCTDVAVGHNTRTGGKRGILIDQCSNFHVFKNTVHDIPTAGAYGILVRGASGTVLSNGSVTGNTVTDCRYGISLWGGEANPAQPGYVADDYTVQRVTVTGNTVVCTDPADGLVGCIFATRARWVTVANNILNGGADVGVDFEYCADSVAVGNTINDVENGALSAIFGSKRIKFLGNKVTFARDRAGTASTAGATWKNTGSVGLLLRDDPQEVEVRGNDFRSLNGTLMQLAGAAASAGVTFVDNDMHDAYFAAFNVSGACTDLTVSRNRARFSVNINNPVLSAQVVDGFTAHDNDVRLIAGEVQESSLRPTLSLYDPSSSTSSRVSIQRNVVHDPAGAANNQIGVCTSDTAMVAVIVDNIADRIVTTYGGAALRAGFTFGGNMPTTGAGATTRLTAQDNAAVVIAAPSTARRDVRATATNGITLTDRDTYTFFGAGATSWTLPPVAGYSGASLLIKSRGAGTLTVASSAGSQVYDTAAVASVDVAPGAVLRLLNDGTYWCTV